MRIIMSTGGHHQKQWTPVNCTGYIAAAIMIEPSDIHSMIVHLDRDPEEFRAALVQWMARFPEERIAPFKPHDRYIKSRFPSDYQQEECPSCHGTGQPGGIKGGPEHGLCSMCGGSGKRRTREPDFMMDMLTERGPLVPSDEAPKTLLDAVADRRDAERYRWLRDGNARLLDDYKIDGGDALDGLCDAKGERQA